MVRRTSRVRYFYIAFALILLMFCWEAQKENTVVFASKAESASASIEGVIPQESIRLRILANSDSPSDQWIKREVRDAIVEQMQQWVTGPQTIEEARQTVRSHLPELSELVGQTLRKNGFDYVYQVELGVVPFPTKMYGNQVYPAGNYEALRVSIGNAEGQNWWCVLFPPLCFVDSEVIAKNPNEVRAEAVPEAEKESANKAKDHQEEKTGKDAKTAKTANKAAETKGAAPAAGKTAVAKADVQPEQPEVRFFLWDLMKKLGSLFA
ncbi:stage II sporulation protein R [Paenibacillus sp. 32352]|uniref:stage II sporulation protein R n=1 Tax=Paenibacillus sp. 32352 TaxID=1969111 RepID=UPI0009AD47D4|nr:stage II sporulation protein R [Paenibacillus sp. 32352]